VKLSKESVTVKMFGVKNCKFFGEDPEIKVSVAGKSFRDLPRIGMAKPLSRSLLGAGSNSPEGFFFCLLAREIDSGIDSANVDLK
jgi:hypothetical protein